MKSTTFQAPTFREHPNTKPPGAARDSVRAGLGQSNDGAHGVTRSTFALPRWRLKLGASLVLGCWCLVFSASAQFAITWSTIDGGGGTSTGGVYSVSGTIGQPDAGGAMTNGQYSVTGGFWALPIAIQVVGSPTLSISPAAPGQATISWTPNPPGFVLQETWSLSPANWTNSLSGATNPITVLATQPNKFYRLFKP